MGVTVSTLNRNWATSGNSNGIQFHPILVKDIPKDAGRGRLGFIASSMFWLDLTVRLDQGLAPMEAVEIELNPTKNAMGKTVNSDQELAAIRHEFRKSGYSKKYSLLVRGKPSHLFVVSHETASMMDISGRHRNGVEFTT